MTPKTIDLVALDPAGKEVWLNDMRPFWTRPTHYDNRVEVATNDLKSLGFDVQRIQHFARGVYGDYATIVAIVDHPKNEFVVTGEDDGGEKPEQHSYKKVPITDLVELKSQLMVDSETVDRLIKFVKSAVADDKGEK